MDAQKVRDAIAHYRQTFEAIDIAPQRCAPDRVLDPGDRAIALAHAHWMLCEMERLLEEGRTSKVMRWLGFVQGVLWSCGVFSISVLKEHNRPDET